jgi:hypothetical protein
MSFMKQWFSRFRFLAFPVILFILACSLYLSNIHNLPVLTSGGTFDTNKSVILALYQAANFVYFVTSKVVHAGFYPFLLLFVGMVGVFQMLVSFKLYKNRYLPFIGSIFFALNIGTFWFFSYVTLPLLFLFALLPWQLWILFQIMKGSTLTRGQKLLYFFFIQLATAPAFSYPGTFTFFLALIGVLCISMIFSRSIFRVMSHGPVYLLFIVLLNVYWFLPRLYLFIDNNKTVLAFNEAINQSLQVITFPQFLLFIQRQPGIISALQIVFLVIIGLGILRFSRYHIPFLLTSFILSFPFWLKLPVDIPELKSFLASISLPGIIFILIAGSFFFVNGLAAMLSIYTFLHKRFHAKKNKIHPVTLQSLMKSPFEMYQELIDITHKDHPHKHFTPLQFTEHFLNHLLTMKIEHDSHTEKRKHLEVRYLCYAIFLLIIISGVSAFQGNYFELNPGNKTVKKDDSRILALLESLTPEKKAIMSQYSSELEYALASENEQAVTAVFEKYGLRKENPVAIFESLPNIGPPADGLINDRVFQRHGNYITTDSAPFDVYYPFRVFEGKDFTASNKATTLKQEIQQNLMKRLGDYDIESATESSEIQVVNSRGETIAFDSSPYVEMNGDKLDLNFESRPLEVINPGQFKLTPCPDGTSRTCFSFDHHGLEHQYGYLITVTSSSKNPDILPFAIEDLKHNHTYFEGNIDSIEQNIVLPPSFVHGVGYSFILKSPHYKDWTIHISYLPFKEIQDVRFVSRVGIPNGKLVGDPVIKKINSTHYEVSIPKLANGNNSILAFYQDEDEGWKAYKVDRNKVNNVFDLLYMKIYPFAYVKEVGIHTSLNTWANAWQMNNDWSNSTILLLFWPQYLEYAGIGIVTFFFIIFAIIRFKEWYSALKD